MSRDNIIKRGMEEEILDALAQGLNSGDSVLDENMNYCFISTATYDLLGLDPKDLKVGHNLTDAHNLMIEQGLISQDSLQKRNLTKDQTQTNAVASAQASTTQLMKLQNNHTYEVTRQQLSNGLHVSIASDVTHLTEQNQLLQQTLDIGKSAYWVYSIATKKYQISDSFRDFIGQERIEQFEKHGVLSLITPDDRDIFKNNLQKALKSNDLVEFEARYILNLSLIHI